MLKCKKCKGNLVAGPYPKWFCLNDECTEYLIPKNSKGYNIDEKILRLFNK